MAEWTDAVLTVRTEECIVAILPHAGWLCVAAEHLEETTDRPSGMAGLNRHQPGGYASTSGRAGAWSFKAGYLPALAPRGGGPSWRVVDNGEVWIATGPAAERWRSGSTPTARASHSPCHPADGHRVGEILRTSLLADT